MHSYNISTGLQESVSDRREAEQEEERTGQDNRTERLDSRNAADTESESAARDKSGKREVSSKKQGKLGRGRCENGSDPNWDLLKSEERWRDFPTVSPVHRGNDGLPFPVDRLTIPFSQWRTGSIKAYGNAIVPQVMYEIFRTIQEVENNGKGED